jgi:hypothetical protein
MKVDNKEELSEMPNIKNKINLLHPFQCKYSQVEKLILVQIRWLLLCPQWHS